MPELTKWAATAARILYEAYPDHDLLPIEPPTPGETIAEFKVRAEGAGDTLFLFLCREADDEIDAGEFLARLDRAVRDIEGVEGAFRGGLYRRSPDGAGSAPVNLIEAGTAFQNTMIRLTLDGDWIEITLAPPDAQGRRSGSIASSLHSSDAGDDQFNTAMDAVESLVLGHACAGIDVNNPQYVEGVRGCLQACANRL